MKNRLRYWFVALAVAFSFGATTSAQDSRAKLDITQVPPAGSGEDSRGDIAGRLTGVSQPETVKIVLYAHTNRWYVQPTAESPYTDVSRDGKWSNWTHLGRRYAALAVRSTFKPQAMVDSLPAVGGDVLAKVEVGAKQ